MNDPRLVERLAGAESPNKDGKILFTRKIKQENSALLNFILWWLLPCVLMIMLWRSAGKSLKARMGGAGNFMSFGNSGA